MSVPEQTTTRAEQRKQRLLEAEREVAREEADALKLTEEQRIALLQPFTSVKAEFTDLDGLRWTQTALRYHQPPNQQRPSHVLASGSPGAQLFSPASTSASPDSKTFVVLTNSDLKSFSAEDTVRPSARSSRPTSLLSLSLYSPKTTKGFKKTNARQVISIDDLRGHRNGTRTRSPVKGLFLGYPTDDSVSASPSNLSLAPQSVRGRPTTAALAMNELAVALSDEGDIGAGPPGLSRAPTYSLAPPSSSLTSRSLSTSPPCIDAIEATPGRRLGASELDPDALYDTRNPAAYGYPCRDAASPTNDQSPTIISASSFASRSAPSLVTFPPSRSGPSHAPVPAPAAMSRSAPPDLLSVPESRAQSRSSPRMHLQSLMQDDRSPPAFSESTVRGLDFPLPPQAPPGLASAPGGGAGNGVAVPTIAPEAFRKTSPSTAPPGVRGTDDPPHFEEEEDITQAARPGQTVGLAPLDLSYRYAYDMAYESESEDDVTPTPSPTFSPGELHLGSGAGSHQPSSGTAAVPIVPAPSGSRWYRPWMSSA